MPKSFYYDTRRSKLQTLVKLLNWFAKAYPDMDTIVYMALTTVLDNISQALVDLDNED